MSEKKLTQEELVNKIYLWKLRLITNDSWDVIDCREWLDSQAYTQLKEIVIKYHVLERQSIIFTRKKEQQKITVTRKEISSAINEGRNWDDGSFDEGSVQIAVVELLESKGVEVEMTVKEILIEWLKSHKYEGLCNQDIECGCGVDDFMPCGGDYGVSECEPAVKKIAKDNDNEYGNYKKGDIVFVPIKSAGK